MNRSRSKLIRKWCEARWTVDLERRFSRHKMGEAVNPFHKFYRAVKRYWVRHHEMPEI